MNTRSSSPVRRVKMIAATYIKGVVAEVGTELQVAAALASEFVGNGRAIYLEPSHSDVASPPSAELSPPVDLNPSVDVHPLVGGPAPSSTLSLTKAKSYA